jgi:hypothetical protein
LSSLYILILAGQYKSVPSELKNVIVGKSFITMSPNAPLGTRHRYHTHVFLLSDFFKLSSIYTLLRKNLIFKTTSCYTLTLLNSKTMIKCPTPNVDMALPHRPGKCKIQIWKLKLDRSIWKINWSPLHHIFIPKGLSSCKRGCQLFH